VTRVLVDTNVFLYARGRDHKYREACRALLGTAPSGVVRLEASVEVVQEFTHVLMRRGVDPLSAVAQGHEVSAQCLLHAFDEAVLARALALVAEYSTLGMRDAVHAATALEVDLVQVVSADRVFDRIEGVSRVDPRDPGATWNRPSTPR
jgi:predicted nucleic acid-binding protein